MRLSEMLGQDTGTEIPTGREVPDFAAPEGRADILRTPTKPEMRPQRYSDLLGKPQTAYIQALLKTPGMARDAATVLGNQLAPKQSFQVVGEGQQLIEPHTGRVVASGPQKYHPPTVAGPGASVFQPGQTQPSYTVPDKPIPLSPGQSLVDLQGRVITKTPERAIPVSPGQQLLEPETGRRVGGVADRPIVVAPGSSVVDPTTGRVLFTAKDRPVALAPGGAIVDPTTGQKIFQLPESPKNGVVIEEDGKQVLIDPVTGTRREEYGPKPTGTKPTDINAMRHQFLQQSVTMGPVRDAYLSIERIAQRPPTAFGDMSLLYSYIKLLDPNSAVREGEFATADQAKSIPEAVRTLYNRAWAGQRLTAVRRRDVLGQARNIAAARLQGHEQIEAEYRRLAQSQGFNADEIVPDLLGELRGRLKGPAPLQPATKDEYAKARRDARGDPMKTNQLLRQRGLDPDLDMIEEK